MQNSICPGGNAKKRSLSSVGDVQLKMEQPNSNNHAWILVYVCIRQHYIIVFEFPC